MKHWIMSDWHLGHTAKMVEYCGRPWNYNAHILGSLASIDPNDNLIFLGDICIGNDAYWHSLIPKKLKRVLVKGNHDRRSHSWYMNHGWNMVVNSFTLNVFGKKLIFTHKPLEEVPEGYLNIHGHCHNDYRYVVSPDKILVKCEHDYRPVLLSKLVSA